MRRALAIYEKHSHSQHDLRRRNAAANLAQLLLKTGRPAEAEELLSRHGR